MNLKDEIRRKIEFLEDVLEELERRGAWMVHVCIDCEKVDFGHKYFDTWECERRGHKVIFTDVSHNGIGEWISCLKWVLEKMEECER